jgi:NO-binding membrane sensor protein with MHYT domain
MMDLGIVVPAAIASGLTLLRGRDSARKPMYAILGGYTLIGASVAAMAITMLVSGDPDASLGLTTAFTLFALALALAFAALSVSLYRPLFNHDEQRVRRDAVAATTPSRVPR